MTVGDRATDAVDRLEDVVDSVTDTAAPGDVVAAFDEVQTLAAAVEHADNFEDVVDEVGDLAGTIDAVGLLSTLDWESLPDAVDDSTLPAVGSDDEDGSDGTHLDVRSVVDPGEIWPHVDVREAWRQLRELEAELEELVGRGDDEADGGDDADDVLPDGPSVSLVDGSDLHGETAENAIQAGVSDAVGEFREGLLALHDRLEAMYEANREQSETRRSEQSTSRNPTAVSTVSRTGFGRHAVRHSTVPEETRYSSAPNRKRIYGGRFADTAGDDDE